MTKYSGIQGVLRSLHVVGCVVHMKDLVMINEVVVYDNSTALS